MDGGWRLMPSLNAEIAPDIPPALTLLPYDNYLLVPTPSLSFSHCTGRWACVCCCCYGRAIADRIALSPLSHRMYRTVHPPTYISERG